ncbi:hypothetical protein C2845_PM07G02550 [Panicum miliaceum]|uniref:SIAH-type domain-containing protein n=1 Tax=Panicum miliaceum TaxID=4540 RepID=A0A3L6SMF2_PANMI|nr:hypothetical protein C2845_PM07G02550 [Panicum miliaceum]
MTECARRPPVARRQRTFCNPPPTGPPSRLLLCSAWHSQPQIPGSATGVESPSVPVKQEVAEQGHSSGGASAMVAVAVEVTAPREELVLRIDKAKIHCPRCTVTLKPPIFQFQVCLFSFHCYQQRHPHIRYFSCVLMGEFLQCEAGHLACSDCHEHLPKNKCYSCFLDGTYIRVPALEDHLLSARIPCPFGVHGCRAYVAYCEAGDHQRECPWAPCRCAEPGCTFVGSPPMLRDHLKDAHAWPVDKVRYGRAHSLRLPESQPRRRLLDAEEDDGRVFVVSVGARGATVACVRAAAARPQYFCKMWATGNPGPATGRVEVAMVDADVRSISSVPGDAPADAVPLPVPRSMLHGAAMEMHLCVRIDKAPK